MEIHVSNHTELPRPTLIRTLKLDDESASKSHHNLVHMFKLPKIGDYAWDFKVSSQALRWNFNPHATTSVTLPDYIEAVHLAITCPESTIAYTSTVILSENSVNTQDIEMNFFREMPILLAGMQQEDVYVIVRFRKQPPASYTLEYQVGFLDAYFLSQIENSAVHIHTGLLQGNCYVNRVLSYRQGKLLCG
jgi:hypothetical protein